MRRCRSRLPAPRSSFAGFRFPPEVITVAVRWYLRYWAVLPRRRRAAGRAWHRGRSRHGVPLGAAIHAPAHRRSPALPARPGRSLVRRRNLRQGRRQVGLSVPGDRPVRAGHRRAGLPEAGHGGDPPIRHPRTSSTGRRPTEVITDKAAVYPPVLEEIAPGAWHHTRALRQQPGRSRSPPADVLARAHARSHTAPLGAGDQRRARVTLVVNFVGSWLGRRGVPVLDYCVLA